MYPPTQFCGSSQTRGHNTGMIDPSYPGIGAVYYLKRTFGARLPLILNPLEDHLAIF